LYSLKEETDTSSIRRKQRGFRSEKEKGTGSIVKKNYFREESLFL
jgi:hypothetical protein